MFNYKDIDMVKQWVANIYKSKFFIPGGLKVDNLVLIYKNICRWEFHKKFQQNENNTA